jgi:branched-chain amino acid transport system substrate-binding protein
MKRVIAGTLCLLAGLSVAHADPKTINIGVLEDMSGLYADATGKGSVVAAEMAVEDSGLAQKGWTVRILGADHQNKTDLGVAIARKWIDEDNVDMITGLGSSGVALAVIELAKNKNKAALVASAGSSDITGKACSPNTIHWTYDTYALANSTGTVVTKNGGDTWFLVVADYAFGAALDRDVTTAIERAGGKVIGRTRHPLNTADYSSFLLQAQNSGAKVVGFANAGSDATNSIKQASEYGLPKKQKIAALLMYLHDLHALGLQDGQGLNLTATFYWDMNDATRSFAQRFYKRMNDSSMPSMDHAGVYAVVLHYLKAAQALSGDVKDGAKVVAKMKEIPTDDPLFGQGKIRADGRYTPPVYLFQVKTPAESKGPWDLYKLVATTPGETAFRPLNEGGCTLVSTEATR